jgi:hypothetical protein
MVITTISRIIIDHCSLKIPYTLWMCQENYETMKPMGKFPQNNVSICAYFIRIEKRNNFVEDFFSIRAFFRRENSI